MSEQEILEKALALPASERLQIVEKLLNSLDQADPALDAEWGREAEARIEAYDRGEMKGIPAEDVRRKYQRN